MYYFVCRDIQRLNISTEQSTSFVRPAIPFQVPTDIVFIPPGSMYIFKILFSIVLRVLLLEITKHDCTVLPFRE